MSFDRYKERVRQGAPPVDNSVAAPATDDAKATAETGPQVQAPAITAPVIAAPKRPLNPPIMPGINMGFQVDVSSTSENFLPPAQVVTRDGEPVLQPPQSDWQNAAAAAQREAQAKKEGIDPDDHSPLDVRMSFLPNLDIAPIPAINTNSTHGRSPSAFAAAKPAEKPVAAKSAADKAICDAIDAYKKQQLEALQSDRQTLAALQAVIAQMGLQKQLNFIAGAQGSVGAEAENTPANMDLPAIAPSTSHP